MLCGFPGFVLVMFDCSVDLQVVVGVLVVYYDLRCPSLFCSGVG